MSTAMLAALKTPQVRDLAWLLSAPSPWFDPHDTAPSRLLGAQGWPQLLALDADPAPLLMHLAAHPVRRLGFYAEQLLAFWIYHAPHLAMHAANLPVRDGLRTVGEFDFLLTIDGEPWHLETASKFYLQLALPSGPWVGASLRDALHLKADKTQRQLQLSQHPAAILPPGFAPCQVGARTTGWLFLPAEGAMPILPPLNPAACLGWWCLLDQPWPQAQEDSRWCHLPRLRWLSPALLPEAETLALAELQFLAQSWQTPQLVAELQQQADGCWLEVARGFVAPQGWPQPDLLTPLLARLG